MIDVPIADGVSADGLLLRCAAVIEVSRGHRQEWLAQIEPNPDCVAFHWNLAHGGDIPLPAHLPVALQIRTGQAQACPSPTSEKTLLRKENCYRESPVVGACSSGITTVA